MRYRLIYAFLCLLLLPAFDCVGGEVLHRAVYVSSSMGNDSNDGLSEQTPVRSVSEALKKGDKVLLKCGDVFFENVEFHSRMISKYGRGDNPKVCGFKRIIQPRWEQVEKNIWRISLAQDNYTGFNTGGSSLLNNIGCIHEYDKDEIHGKRVQHRADLKEGWDFWQTERHGAKVVAPADFDWVYLYLTTNPNQLKLEFSVATAGVRISNATLDGISVVGFGFGISAGTKSIIKNCQIDAIGGMQFRSETSFVSYGNGIEFYVSKNIEDCLVENNRISRCFDCGITIQGNNGGRATPRNIIIRGNTISECCQGWEDFLRNDPDVVYENCVFENNTLLNNGNTSGFGYADNRFKFCHVLGNNYKGDRGMIIRNNTFVGGNYYCSGAYQGKYKSNVWEGNTCIIRRGDFILSNYGGTKDVILIPTEKGEFSSLKAATDDAIQRYRGLTGDQTTRFVIRNEATINRRVNELKKEYKSQ